MTKEELGQRLISCKNWQWLGGMLTTCNLRVVEGGTDYIIGYRSGPTNKGGGWYDGEAKGFLPDLFDHATGGLILHLLAEQCHTQISLLSAGTDEWEIWTLRGRTVGNSLGVAAANVLLEL